MFIKLLRFLIFIVIFYCNSDCSLFAQQFKLPETITDKDYISNAVIFRVKPEYRSLCTEQGVSIPALTKIFDLINAQTVWKKFPGKKSPETDLNKYGEKMEDLSLIYELKYSNTIKIQDAANYLLSSGVLIYAEPHYLPQLLYVPNDPAADTSNTATFKQCALKQVKAYQAWEIQEGDTNIVVGISDTGTEVFHPDLLPNNKINYYDPINGIDDDNDGFTDNYYGWDLGENDNNPQYNTIGHGVFVSGITAGVVNNSIGIAGIGFKSKYLPVKIDNATGSLVMAYESIIYAVDHGACVVNCSWGGYSGAGQFGQNVVNYATNNMDALVVAAAGNSDNDYLIYPASYNYVLSVANVDCSDIKAPTSSYGSRIDLSAPGLSVYSTWVNGGYTFSTGTSFSAPLVAGAAAILKAHFPLYSAIQIAQQLKSTTDYIDAIPANLSYAGQLGTGRLNLYRALTESGIPSVVMLTKVVGDNNDGTFTGHDTLRIWGTYKNFLAPTSAGFKATLTSTSPYVQVLNNSTTLGIIPMLGTKDNSIDKYTVKILPSIPVGYSIDFKLKYEDVSLGYVAYDYFSVIANIDYINIDTNKVASTVTSKGRIGYNQVNYQQGLGFTYNNGASLVSTGGFLIGSSTGMVSDNIYGSTSGNYDDDFKLQKVVRKIIPPVISDFETTCMFNDSLAGSTKMGLSIRHNAFAWDSAGAENFIIHEFIIKNNSTTTYPMLYCGIYMDWDISTDDGLSDRANYDATNKMGYVFSSLGGVHAGIKLLSPGTVHHYAFDNDGGYNGSSSSIKIIDGFTGFEKYNALKTANRNLAGVNNNGNDVSDLMSTGPFSLIPGDSATVAFALLAGDNLTSIQGSAEVADELYNHTSSVNEMITDKNPLLLEVTPNPVSDRCKITFNIPESGNVSITIIDSKGKEVLFLLNAITGIGYHQLTPEISSLGAGMYQVCLSYKSKVYSRYITIVK